MSLRTVIAAVALLLLPSAATPGQSVANRSVSNPSASNQQTSAEPLPAQLVRATVTKEIEAANDLSVRHMFRDYKKSATGTQTRLYVETREAMAGMTIAYNDQPLTTEQLQGEEGRLAGLVGNPQQLARKQRQEKEEADHTLAIMRALPDAFLFDYDGSEMGTATLGRAGVRLARLKFRPNPSYRPPSHVEEVLTGMQGTVLIDPEAHRIARVDGTLFKEVIFGWGILGHLDKGGHFLVEQEGLGDGSWDVSRMTLSFNGKILLFRNMSIRSDEVFSDFQRVPADTSFAQGVQMLKAERAKLSQKHAVTAKTESASR